jgi:hypothetical protein
MSNYANSFSEGFCNNLVLILKDQKAGTVGAHFKNLTTVSAQQRCDLMCFGNLLNGGGLKPTNPTRVAAARTLRAAAIETLRLIQIVVEPVQYFRQVHMVSRFHDGFSTQAIGGSEKTIPKTGFSVALRHD